MFASLVIDRIFGLGNASFIVFPNDCSVGHGMAELLEELAEIDNGSTAVECSDLLGFRGRLSDYHLEVRRPVNWASAEINDESCLAAATVAVLTAEAGISEGLETKGGFVRTVKLNTEMGTASEVAGEMVECFETGFVRIGKVPTEAVDCESNVRTGTLGKVWNESILSRPARHYCI